jgi:ribosomal protein S18 acetylase RimI-like enzyme
MVASTLSKSHPETIRRLDLSKDLDAVADLIEMCFPIHRDPDGQSYVHEMRKAARDMRVLGWLNNLAEMGTQKSAGFVWEEDGAIIGNLSLIPFQYKNQRIHLIANVAVHRDHRRNGIGRALTLHALNYLRRRGEQEAWLQVRQDNPGAVDLYRAVGFKEQVVRTTWRIRPLELQDRRVALQNSVQVKRGKSGDRQKHQTWLERAYPLNLRWNFGVDFNRFDPGFFQWLVNILDGVHLKHWCVRVAGEVVGVITWQKTTTFANSLWLAFEAEKEADYLPAALEDVLSRLSPRHPLSIDYPQGRSQHQFDSMGFEAFRTLIWMKCRL